MNQDLFLSGCVVVLVAGLALTCLYGLMWLFFGRKEYTADKTVKAKVIATRYQPHRTHTHLGTGISSNGQLNTMLISEDEEEEDIVLLRSTETGRLELNSAELLDSVEQGEEVELTYKEKYVFWTWDPSHKKFDSFIPVSVKNSKGEEIKL